MTPGATPSDAAASRPGASPPDAAVRRPKASPPSAGLEDLPKNAVSRTWTKDEVLMDSFLRVMREEERFLASTRRKSPSVLAQERRDRLDALFGSEPNVQRRQTHERKPLRAGGQTAQQRSPRSSRSVSPTDQKLGVSSSSREGRGWQYNLSAKGAAGGGEAGRTGFDPRDPRGRPSGGPAKKGDLKSDLAKWRQENAAVLFQMETEEALEYEKSYLLGITRRKRMF